MISRILASRVPLRALVVMLLAALLAGCPIPMGNRVDISGSPPVLNGPVSYTFDIQPIFDKNCSYCHRAGGVSEIFAGIPLRLTHGETPESILNQPSALRRNWMLVVPGDPNASMLYRKVADSLPPAGLRMPLFDQRLADEEIELIRRWIEEGAEP